MGRDKISLLEEELLQLSIKSSLVVSSDSPMLLCFVWTRRSYNPDSFRVQMKSIWKTTKKFDIQVAGQNLFLITFNDENDLELIMDGRPWLFRKQVIIFVRLTTPIDRSQIWLVTSPVWLKIGSCPPYCNKKDLLHAIGMTFGGVIRSEFKGVDAWDTGLRSARFCPTLRKRDQMRFHIFCGTKGKIEFGESWGKDNSEKPKRPSWKRLARNVMLDKKDTSSITDKRKYGVESKRDYDSCTLDKTGSKRARNVDIIFDNAQIDVGLLGNLEFYSTAFILGPDYKVSIEVNGKERCKKMGIKWIKVRR
ncbi:hypothetical protein PVK06_039504 [Gossypium arboreum]|uniref:DUF4283 domain-containing protein n=1 Tax=Gossypium arboreum TaxID=29729 RepID=A0ABR0N3S8_GOSAR|nr:hypothetical protein PVK06_039504 [Gossypium arboreum]